MIPPVMPDPNRVAARQRGRRSPQQASWRDELREAVRSSAALLADLGLAAADIAREADEPEDFPVLVPRSYLARMRHGDAGDPLLRQVLALRRERLRGEGYVADPLNERDVAQAGVLRKYSGRALLVTTAACPVHCRYCFRRHFPYSEQLAARGAWAAALDILRSSPGLQEVILSGGDPLTLSSTRLAELVAALEDIDSLTTLRVHTRFPIVLPARVTAALLEVLESTRLRTVVVVHTNHANELDHPQVCQALRALSASSDMLLNQSVLLRGINDSVEALRALSNALFAAGVAPYYLHMLDPVAGSTHFEVSLSHARKLVQQLRAVLPGYLVPQLVREEPGALSKTPVC